MPTNAQGRRVRSLTGVNNLDSGEGAYTWPTTQGEWIAHYERLHAAYLGDPYTLADVKGLHLFRALDNSNQTIDITTRLTRDIQHVVDVDTAAIAGVGLRVEGSEAAELCWKRTQIPRHVSRWARVCASMGDLHLEAVRQSGTKPYQSEIVAYDPRHVELTYDAQTGRRLERAVITVPYFDEGDVSPTGEISRFGALHTYVRVLDREEIAVYVDGKRQDAESGPHNLGVVPLVHIPFLPYTEPEHGLWAAVGLERPLALLDSLLTQIKAVGNRHANPLLAMLGVKIGDDADVFKLGRVISGVPSDGDVKYVEATMAGLSTILKTIQAHLDNIRATTPEFIFTEGGAAESGLSRSYRASLFVSKMEDVRARFYGGIEDAIDMCVALDEDREYRPGEGGTTVTGGPILPPDVTSTLDALQKLKDLGALQRIDVVRKAQALGFVDAGLDPAKYAAEAEDEQSARALQFFGDRGSGA
jgi:hypothetical protein